MSTRFFVLALGVLALPAAARGQFVIGASFGSGTHDASGLEGGANPAPIPDTLTNNEGVDSNWSFDPATIPAWLTITPNSGTLANAASTALSLDVNLAGMPPGTYNAFASLQWVATGNAAVLRVTLTVTASGPITPVAIDAALAGVSGGSTDSGSFVVFNLGPNGSARAYIVADDAPWLTVTPGDTTLAGGASQTHQLAGDPAALVAGTYNATVTITDLDGPKTLAVSFTVATRPTIGVSPASAALVATAGGGSTVATLTISNAGTGAPLNWSASDNAPWLTVVPSSGSLAASTSEPVALVASLTGLAAGTHNAQVTISDPNATNSPVAVVVNLQVAPASGGVATISASPGTLSFEAAQGGAAPAAQTLTLANAGLGTLDWTASDDAAWLSATPAAGQLSAAASASLTLSADPSGLDPGTYSATFTLADPAASNSPQTVAVTFLVRRPGLIAVTDINVLDADATGLPVGMLLGRFAVVNTGPADSVLDLAITAEAAWATPSPASGTVPGGGAILVDTLADTQGLTPGTHRAGIQVLDRLTGTLKRPEAIVTVFAQWPEGDSALLAEDFTQGLPAAFQVDGFEVVASATLDNLPTAFAGSSSLHTISPTATLTFRLDLTAAGHAWLSFMRRDFAASAVVTLELATDGFQTTAASLTLDRTWALGDWGEHRVVLDPYAGKVLDVRIRVTGASGKPRTADATGLYLDDLRSGYTKSSSGAAPATSANGGGGGGGCAMGTQQSSRVSLASTLLLAAVALAALMDPASWRCVSRGHAAS